MAGDNICLKVEITNVSQIKTALRDVPHMQGSKCTEHAYTHTHTHIYIYNIYTQTALEEYGMAIH